MLISLTKIKDIHTYLHTASDQISLLSSVMSYDDSVHWHGRAKETLARAEQMNECVTKHVLRRVADAYEGLARKAEKQAKQFPPSPVSRMPLPAEARQFPPRKGHLVACVKQMDECASELVLRRVADACECLARTAGQPAKRFPPNPVSKTPVVPTEARQFAPRKGCVGASPARVLSVEIPSFLKRGPRAEEDVMPFRPQILGIAAGRLRQILFFTWLKPKSKELARYNKTEPVIRLISTARQMSYSP
jgi:hypothetical protein